MIPSSPLSRIASGPRDERAGEDEVRRDPHEPARAHRGVDHRGGEPGREKLRDGGRGRLAAPDGLHEPTPLLSPSARWLSRRTTAPSRTSRPFRPSVRGGVREIGVPGARRRGARRDPARAAATSVRPRAGPRRGSAPADLRAPTRRPPAGLGDPPRARAAAPRPRRRRLADERGQVVRAHGPAFGDQERRELDAGGCATRGEATSPDRARATRRVDVQHDTTGDRLAPTGLADHEPIADVEHERPRQPDPRERALGRHAPDLVEAHPSDALGRARVKRERAARRHRPATSDRTGSRRASTTSVASQSPGRVTTSPRSIRPRSAPARFAATRDTGRATSTSRWCVWQPSDPRPAPEGRSRPRRRRRSVRR